MNFDFPTEMKKKHLKKVDFNQKEYDLAKIVTSHFNYDLSEAHLHCLKYPVFKELGKDSHTIFHRNFYDKIDSGWSEFTETYHSLLSEVVLPFLGLKEALIQKYPSFRVQLPDNVAIVVKHYDADEKHNHPKGEINFIYALTDMFATNTVKVEKMPRSDEYVDLNLNQGELICFNGNLCSHYNVINQEGKTRMSFDFRILPLNYYQKDNQQITVTTGKKYIEGEYYIRMKSKEIKEIKEIKGDIKGDIWNKEKSKFAWALTKYNVKDAWGIVNIFEQKLAYYYGSKYAVTVDCCTNAIFLCLKWLKKNDTDIKEIILPNKTWISVPQTVINAGFTVKFEDIKWSGSYQLSPAPIYDRAVQMKRNAHIKNTFSCLSFHIRKHLPIGRGGAILTDSKEAYDWLRKVRYCGRNIDKDGINYVLYKDDIITESPSWNAYLTPEQAEKGIRILEEKEKKDEHPDQETSGSCKDLKTLNLF